MIPVEAETLISDQQEDEELKHPHLLLTSDFINSHAAQISIS